MEITALNNIHNSSTALSSAVKGVRESEVRFAEAANDLIKTFAAAANVTSSATSGTELSPETLAAANDPISPLINMKTSQIAYEANLVVFSAIDEMTESLLDVLA